MNYNTIRTQLQQCMDLSNKDLKSLQIKILENHNLVPYELQCLLFEKLIEQEVYKYYISL
jgi:hypothetical protein